MGELSRFGVSAEEELLQNFDRLIGEQGYANRSEALRDLMRRALVESKLGDVPAAGEVLGSLTLVYDHHASNLQAEMAEIQHKHHDLIISVMHLHVSHDDCLELIALSGAVNQISELAHGLLSLKGIKHGKLFLTLPSSEIASDPHH